MNDLAALQPTAMGWDKHQPSDDVHQQEHTSLLINCSDVDASSAYLNVHLPGMEVKE